MKPAALINELSPPLDDLLTKALFSEFVDIQRRFVLGEWEHATLDGGQFAEIASRIIYHIDSGNLNHRKTVDRCLRYIEDPQSKNVHHFPSRQDSLYLCRTIRTIYKLRSSRGAIHIDPEYTANELDSSLILSITRWIISEILRIFWNGNAPTVARIIREIIRFDVPAIIEIDDQSLVLQTNCTAEEEVLLLIHNAGERGLSRQEVGKSAMIAPPSVTRALKQLLLPTKRQIFKRNDGAFVLTPNGAKRIQESLSGKLVLR